MVDNGAQNPEELTDEQIYQEIGKIVSTFNLFKCAECAQAVIQWLQEHGVEGTILKLKTKNPREAHILSDRFVETESITNNGKHYGVEVRGKVFDNLSTEGMLREDWLKDFHCESEQFTLEELDRL